MAKASQKSAKDKTFEQALTELENIVQRLEDGDLGLDEALQHYEEGVGLLKHCQQLLQTAEKKIEVLTGVDAEGRPITQPFADKETPANG